MFVCAAVGFADVTSANVVGYNNITLRSGKYMTGSNFDMIGKAGMRLTDLKPTGYEDVVYWSTGKGGPYFSDMVTVTLLNYQGKKQKEWKWIAMYDKAAGKWNPGYWYDVEDTSKTPIVAGSEADYEFGVGDGLWVAVDASAYSKAKVADNKYKLSNSGEAMLDPQTVTLRSGKKGVIAPLSRPVRLTEINPTGYEDVVYWSTGKGGPYFSDMVTITLLNYQGKKQKEWKWIAMYDKAAGKWNPGYWYDVEDTSKTPIVAGSEADYEFGLGDGLWVAVDASAYSKPKVADNKYSLAFPGVDDDNTKE